MNIIVFFQSKISFPPSQIHVFSNYRRSIQYARLAPVALLFKCSGAQLTGGELGPICTYFSQIFSYGHTQGPKAVEHYLMTVPQM